MFGFDLPLARPAGWAVGLALGLLTGCDEVEATAQGLDGGLYNPCGAGKSVDDCPGGKPAAEGDAYGSGLFTTVIGSQGTHWLEVNSLGCTLEMDSEGIAAESDLCPDCSLVLELTHTTAVDGCGVGDLSYETLIGLVPGEETGDYTVFVSIYDGDWYAVGGAEMDGWTLRYSAAAVYDYAYDYYGGIPNYSFVGEHDLILNGTR